jgi:hypothetical protein
MTPTHEHRRAIITYRHHIEAHEARPVALQQLPSNRTPIGIAWVLLDLNAAPTLDWVAKINSIYQSNGLSTPANSAIAGIVAAGKGSARTIFTDLDIAESKRNKSTSQPESINTN